MQFAIKMTRTNLFLIGETDYLTAENFIKRANIYMSYYFPNLVPATIIIKKKPFLVLNREQGFYRIEYEGKIGYIQALSIFKIRESIERI